MRNTRKSPCRRWRIGKNSGRKVHHAACNRRCCRWISGCRCLLSLNRINASTRRSPAHFLQMSNLYGEHRGAQPRPLQFLIGSSSVTKKSLGAIFGVEHKEPSMHVHKIELLSCSVNLSALNIKSSSSAILSIGSPPSLRMGRERSISSKSY